MAKVLKSQRLILFYTDSRSDKEYQIHMERLASGNYTVYGLNGRRGRATTKQVKLASGSLSDAYSKFEEVKEEKRRKGYTTDLSGTPHGAISRPDEEFDHIVDIRSFNLNLPSIKFESIFEINSVLTASKTLINDAWIIYKANVSKKGIFHKKGNEIYLSLKTGEYIDVSDQNGPLFLMDEKEDEIALINAFKNSLPSDAYIEVRFGNDEVIITDYIASDSMASSTVETRLASAELDTRWSIKNQIKALNKKFKKSTITIAKLLDKSEIFELAALSNKMPLGNIVVVSKDNVDYNKKFEIEFS